MGKDFAGATHKMHRYVSRYSATMRAERAGTFAVGDRVVVRPMEGAANPYAGRFGAVTEATVVDGESVYHVLLDYYGEEEEAGQPVAFFADELRRTHAPKASA